MKFIMTTFPLTFATDYVRLSMFSYEGHCTLKQKARKRSGNIKHNGELCDSRRERGESLYLGAVVGVSFDGSPCPQAELETCW